MPDFQAAVHASRIALINFAFVLVAQPFDRVDIAFRVVEVVACFRIDALDRSDHLGREQDIVDRE